MKTFPLLLALTLAGIPAYAQTDMQLRVRQMPGWDARAREGRCEVRVWVDHRAEVRMRGDSIFVRTVAGSRGRDEGSQCSHPIPFNSVRDFQIRQTSGRNQIQLAQPPNRMNNYTALIAIDDPQGGGDTYTFDVTWRADADVATAPAAFFDDVRACQETVRQRFQAQNGRQGYLDFDNFAQRSGQNPIGDPGERRDGDRRDGDRRDGDRRDGDRRGNRGQETIQGRGVARTRNESRDISYSCIVDMRQNQVISGSYQYAGGNDRNDVDRRPPR